MSVVKDYFRFGIEKMEEVLENQRGKMEKASEIISESCMNGGKFYIFGSGHSHMIAEEAYLRAGGLAYVRAILPPELMLHQMPKKSSQMERLEGYGKVLLDLYDVSSKDVLMIISNSGRNPVPVEMALEGKAKGIPVIALTSLDHSKSSKSRHRSGKRLFEIADIVIDNGSPKGDAGFEIENLDTPIGATSSAVGIMILQALIAQTVDNLVKKGHQPPVFKSSNVDGADEYNEDLFDKYYPVYPK